MDDEQGRDILLECLEMECERLLKSEPGSKEEAALADNISKFCKIRLDEDRVAQEYSEKMFRRDYDEKVHADELVKIKDELNERKLEAARANKLSKIKLWVEVGGILVPATVYLIGHFTGLHFEEHGTPTSAWVRALINKMPLNFKK